MLFFLRRIAFVLSAIYLGDFVWGQIQLQLSFALANILFILWCQPYESRFDNIKEALNEAFILCLSYMAISFTDFVPDPEIRNELGRCYNRIV